MTAILTLRPLITTGTAAAGDRPLAGGPLYFARCEAVVREAGQERAREIVAIDAAATWAERYGLADAAAEILRCLSAPRPPLAGLDLSRPQVMGVLNVTPDSFSDGGDRFTAETAIADGLAMRDAGAAILDVGGESTRPGAAPVDVDEEVRRVVPVVAALARAGALVSIDSRHAPVIAAALDAGARIVNDVTALSGDADSLPLVARRGVPVILMHMQGEPRTMQRQPTYADAPLDVYDVLAARVDACEAAGIPRHNIAVDPGIGFGKSVDHNLRVLDQVAVLHGLGCALVLGVSRKSFIGRLAGTGTAAAASAKARLPGSLAGALAGVARGVQIVRVHDVAETAQALAVWTAIGKAGHV